MIKHFLTFLLACGVVGEASAQLSIGLGQLFKPNIRVRYQYAPMSAWADSTQAGYQHLNIATIIPLGGGVEAKLSELKLAAHQTFLNLSAGSRQVDISHLREQVKLGNATIGITHVSGRVGRGVWVYSAQVGAVANFAQMDKPNIFGLGAIAKLQIKGLRKQNIFGLAVVASSTGVLPVPILGWNRKLADRWDMSLLLPLQANISYKASKKSRFEWQNNFYTVAFPIDAQTLQYTLPTAQWAQYFDIRSSIEFTHKVDKDWHFMLEAGCMPFRSLLWRDGDRKTLQTFQGGALGWFVSAGVRINLQQGWLSSQLFESE